MKKKNLPLQKTIQILWNWEAHLLLYRQLIDGNAHINLITWNCMKGKNALKGIPLTIDLFLGKSLSKSRLIPIKYNLITVQIILLATQRWGSLNLNLFTYNYNPEQLQRCQTCVIIIKKMHYLCIFRLDTFYWCSKWLRHLNF